MPTIAAIEGSALGGGLELALGCDLRVAGNKAVLGVPETSLAIIPGAGGTQRLPRLIGLGRAKELMFTGRIISGTEAVALGLATKVSEDPLADAVETAKLIATKSPHAIRAGKALLRDAPNMSRADALKLETALQVSLLGSPNQMEAVQANMTKREPEFKDPE